MTNAQNILSDPRTPDELEEAADFLDIALFASSMKSQSLRELARQKRAAIEYGRLARSA